jgi:hypothetical protein
VEGDVFIDSETRVLLPIYLSNQFLRLNLSKLLTGHLFLLCFKKTHHHFTIRFFHSLAAKTIGTRWQQCCHRQGCEGSAQVDPTQAIDDR